MEHKDQQIDLEQKSGQWLGATLHSTGKDGKVVVSIAIEGHRRSFTL